MPPPTVQPQRSRLVPPAPSASAMVLPSRSAQEGVRICRAETREIFVVEMSVVDFASAQIAFHEKSAAVIRAGIYFAR